MFNKILNPDLYHGNNKKTNYFEGWYFKLVHPHKALTFCFIPGVFISDKEGDSHSFIQVLKGQEASFKYIKYHRDEFEASKSEFNFNIGKNFFSLNKISLDINKQNEKVFGTLLFTNIFKWPDSIINPGSMGFYNYFNFMQCYSQVCALDGSIEGSLNINGEIVDFTGGKVYIEKNWGKDFPFSYIWLQGNSFDKGETSVTCSIGHIPFLFTSFTGFLIGLKVRDRFYKFTTVNRNTLSIECKKNNLRVEARNDKYILKIEGSYYEETFMNLYAPRENGMLPIAKETLQGNLAITLYDDKKHSIILKDYCPISGIEFSGDYKSLY